MVTNVSYGLGTGVSNSLEAVTGARTDFNSGDTIWGAHKWKYVLNNSVAGIRIYWKQKDGTYTSISNTPITFDNGNGTYWHKVSWNANILRGNRVQTWEVFEGRASFHITNPNGSGEEVSIDFTIQGVGEEPAPEPEPEYPKTISDGVISLQANDATEEDKINRFLGEGEYQREGSLDDLLGTMNTTEILEWKNYWLGQFPNRTDIKNLINSKATQYIQGDEPGEIIGPVIPEDFGGINIIKDEEDADTWLNKVFDVLDSYGLFFSVGERTLKFAGVKEEAIKLQRENPDAQLSDIDALKAIVITAGIGTAIAGGIALAGPTAGAAGGASVLSGVGGTLGKAAAQVAGVDVLMVWMAEDNVLSGLSFTLKKIDGAVRDGLITPQQAETEIAKVEALQKIAGDFVTISATTNPVLIPFKSLLLANVEKAYKDTELEVLRIRKTINSL